MTENSDMDDITRETGAMTAKITRLVNDWRTMNPTATRVPRQVRREISRIIRADAADRKFAHAMERSRVERAVIEHRWLRREFTDPTRWETLDRRAERQEELTRSHDRVETAIYASEHLTATERGQAVMAMNTTGKNPYTKPVFGRAVGIDALKARVHDGLTQIRAGLATPGQRRRMAVFEQIRAEREQGPAPTPTTRPEHEQADRERPERDEPGYVLSVGTAEFLREHPELVSKTGHTREARTLDEVYATAAQMLADHMPTRAEIVVTVNQHGRTEPVHTVTGTHGFVTDEVDGWRHEHERAGLSDHTRVLETELAAAHAEIDKLRTENTDLVRKFDHRDRGPVFGARFARPTVAGFARPEMNGFER